MTMKTFLKGRQTESLFEPIYFANSENKIFHQYGRKFPRGEEKTRKDKFALRAKITARISHLEVEGKGEG